MKRLTSEVPLRREARNLNLSRTTIDRKFRYVGEQAKIKLRETNLMHPKVHEAVFDDQETFEHTKCKPLSTKIPERLTDHFAIYAVYHNFFLISLSGQVHDGGAVL